MRFFTSLSTCFSKIEHFWEERHFYERTVQWNGHQIFTWDIICSQKRFAVPSFRNFFEKPIVVRVLKGTTVLDDKRVFGLHESFGQFFSRSLCRVNYYKSL